MPELPEVETVRRSLAPRLLGRRVAAVRAEPAVLRAGIRPAEWRALAGGEALAALRRHGKYLVAEFGPAAAVVHLGMSGRLELHPPEAPCERHTHLRLAFEHGVELRFVDPRRFGMAVVLPVPELPAFAPLAALGVDALDGDVEAALLAAAPRARTPVRSLLLDQGVLSGVGNIYANEALARAGIHPLTPAASLSRARLRRLAAALRAVLADALAAGGTTLADGGFADAEGRGGYFAVALAVYGREGEPCRRCGARVRREVAAGRSCFFCPRCQRR
jgi:formamidopyrimidine-DNA glycosylase